MMPLRSPVFLDSESLFAQAEYHEIEAPRAAQIVETSRSSRSGGGRIGLPTAGLGADAKVGRDIEIQSTYTLAPREKAAVSRVIDGLIASGLVKTASPDTPLSRDDIVEVEGTTRITSASLAGKLFYIAHKAMGEVPVGTSGEVNDWMARLDFDAAAPSIFEMLRSIYLNGELVPVPLLLEVTGTGLSQKVYASLRPNHFVDNASKDHIEGEYRVLGTVSRLVNGGTDGFLSAEQWLLHGWEPMLRRLAMIDVEKSIADLVDKLNLDQPPEDVQAYISGPAVILDAIALY